MQGGDFHRDLSGLAEAVVPQHSMRLDAQSLSARHYGEVSCREFRESVMHALPHRCWYTLMLQSGVGGVFWGQGCSQQHTKVQDGNE